MPVNSTHADYDAIAADWIRARDVIAGEDAVKAAGQKYLPRLDCQTEEEYAAYRDRAAFFNATARTGEGCVGLIFRRAPFVKGPDEASGVGRALADFSTAARALATSAPGLAPTIRRYWSTPTPAATRFPCWLHLAGTPSNIADLPVVNTRVEFTMKLQNTVPLVAVATLLGPAHLTAAETASR